MTAPIPKHVLNSSCVVRVPKADSDYGGEYEEPITIEHVRYVSVDRIRKTTYQLRDTTTGLLFVDAVNSKGAFAIPAGSLVSVDGGPESNVNKCNAMQDFTRVHHWEIELS